MRAVFSKLLSRGRLGRRFEGVVRGSRRFSVVSGDSGTMIQLVEKLGSRREVEQYLKLYSSIDTPRFAVIKVGGGVLADELADLADSLTFLHKAGLRPIVVHGAGPQLNQELANRKIKSDYIEGLRVTSPEIIRIAQNVFESANLKLVEALEQRGTRARPILSGVFKAEIKDPKLGLVGEILNVNLAPIYSAIDAGCMPILTCLGHSEYGQALNINADIAAREVSKAVKPLKVVYISQKGGILDEKGTIIENVDLKDDYAHLLQQSWFKHGDRLKLRQIKELLDALPDTSSVAITSAKLLAKELFTHRGSGTLIRNYERIYSFGKEDFDKIDMERLLTLIESAFDGKLSSEYANYVYTNVHKIYVSELYRAAAIVLKLKNNCHEHNADSSDEAILYLDKFAVLHQFRSDGLGNRLWKRMTAENNTLVWKSRSANEINPWYFMKSHGNIKMNRDWIYFWLGIDDFLQIKRCVDAISKVPKHLFRRGDVDSATIFIRDDCKEYRVGLIGARGHTGSELVQLIQSHPSFELALASSRAYKNKKVKEIIPQYEGNLDFLDVQPADISKLDEKIDLWILALPNNAAKPYVDEISPSKRIIDLSADYRFASSTEWIYGLPERRGARDRIQGSLRVSNPGCYATGSQLALFPLLAKGLFNGNPYIFGVSGYSGAGTSPSPKNDLNKLRDNLMPYSLVNHVHEREISSQLGIPVRFMPHVASWFRGISLTIAVDLNQRISKENLLELYQDYYANETLVRVTSEIPFVQDNAGKHFAAVGGFYSIEDSNSTDRSRVVITATLDNLLKGAATQCIQNTNIMFGLPEFLGIPTEEH